MSVIDPRGPARVDSEMGEGWKIGIAGSSFKTCGTLPPSKGIELLMESNVSENAKQFGVQRSPVGGGPTRMPNQPAVPNVARTKKVSLEFRVGQQ